MMQQTLNPMERISISKVVISCGATDKDLVKATKLLEIISGKKAQIIASKKRIPNFNVRPGLEVGTRITLRDEAAAELLKRLLAAVGNILGKEQVSINNFSFGIEEYIEIPGIEYQRDIGIRGLNVTIVFSRPGVRVKLKKIKSGKLPSRHNVSQEEIIKFMESNFQTQFV